ncbi:hypothetical protein [Streptomyces sp. NPDC006289]|uniref:hypothetical protein n=1 Tax=Streptomyces sp. NPDC006289 TaxID=3156744 RepID=UPI00339EB7D6
MPGVLPGDATAVLRAFAPEETARQAVRPVTTTVEALDRIADRPCERRAGTGYAGAVLREGRCSALSPSQRSTDPVNEGRVNEG